MRAITVYRWDEGKKTKDPIGVVFEKRKLERGRNYLDLLRLARKLYSGNAAGAVHVIIDPSPALRPPLAELSVGCSSG